MLDELKSIYSLKSIVYEKSGDFENSLIFLRKHVEIKDSILNVENNELISEIEAKYESESQNKKIDFGLMNFVK